MSIVLSEILAEKQTVALGGHIRPDGDCVGSVMGLYFIYRNNIQSCRLMYIWKI